MKAKSLIAVLLIATALAGLAGWKWKYAGKAHPDIVVILIDTLRADHLGIYGYTRNTSPNLDRFATEFNRCSYAVSTSVWTPASTLSVLTGMYVRSHHYMPPQRARRALAKRVFVPQALYFLPEALRDAGYATSALSANVWINNELGFGQGFDQLITVNGMRADRLTAEAQGLIRKMRRGKKPFFLYLHYIDPHDPYEPPVEHAVFSGQPLPRRYEPGEIADIDAYDGEIHFTDEQIGKLLDFLRSERLFEDTIIMIVSDHGEQFMEHGFRLHGNQVFNTENHVPLLFKLGKNGPRGRVIHHTVSTVDIYATVLQAAGLPVHPGAALSIPLTDEKQQAAREGVFTAMKGEFYQRAFTAYDGRKLIVGSVNHGEPAQMKDPTQNIVGLFHAREDYFEETPLNGQQDLQELQDGWKKLYRHADALRVGNEPPPASTVSDTTIRQLKSLGYLK